MTKHLQSTAALHEQLKKLRAIWVNHDTLLWDSPGEPGCSYALFYSQDAALSITAEGDLAGYQIPLRYDPGGPDEEVLRKNPYLGGWSAYRIGPEDYAHIPELLKGQLAFVIHNSQGELRHASGVQTAGALDALYSYDGPLGVTFEADIPSLRVWAPSAQSVNLYLYDGPLAQSNRRQRMSFDSRSGVWSVRGEAAWRGKYYLYEVQVYAPSTARIENNLVTDPYSLSLSTNSLRSQMVDLADPATQPEGWNRLAKPALAAFEDIVLYELHIRDFSSHDPGVPQALRGTYLAFTQYDSFGMRHLGGLARAGVSHLHLLPAFDISTVNEDRGQWQQPDEAALAALPPDSDQQAAAVWASRDQDGFNWGYDPCHYTVPEGSYASQPDGMPRLREFRQMVAALNQAGLRVVMDVVYNHTTESGQGQKSVLDKIVPAYYYRLNTHGQVENSTCCSNTASEHAMMEKLMVDSLVTWARDYKIDGFRFDLMGHHMLRSMQAARAALDGLTIEKDGVDGKKIYIYGEGWDFGEVANNARGVNASQRNLAGTGIGSFNDRIRDGVRGGSPSSHPQDQGFCTGLFFSPNGRETRGWDEQRYKLLEQRSWVQIGLAGNLRSYLLDLPDGRRVTGAEICYNGQPAGYALQPAETINYVSAHDNETLFDAVQLKASRHTPLDQRIRMNNLALSVPMFAQGIPFFHAGDDILRSKSLDRNSFDSGDWFNRLDWTLSHNNWGAGLPNEGRHYWDIFRALLADATLKPNQAQISFASAVFREFLAVRKSSALFRLRSAEQVRACLSFLAEGANLPGLIAMRLLDPANLDANFAEIIVLFNASPERLCLPTSLERAERILHPILLASADQIAREALYNDKDRSFSVPGLTTAVFVQPR
jgi:pullulanase-type alpha-1,6-glucosidase